MSDDTSGIIFRSTGIGVSDLARSVDFYTNVLGMKVLQKFELAYMDEVVVGYSTPGTTDRGSRLVLMHWTDGSLRNYANNPVKLVLQVPDAKGIAERLRAAGMEITREPGKSSVSNNTVGMAKDPDGYVLELLQVGEA